MTRRRRLLFVSIALALPLALYVILTRQAAHADTTHCTPAEIAASETVAYQCFRERHMALVAMQQTFVAQPHPTITPWPFTQVPNPEDPDEMVVRQLNVRGGMADDHEFDGASSAWQDGSVATHDHHEWSFLYVLTRPGYGRGHATITTFVSDPIEELRQRYNHTWMCPRDVGTIVITAIDQTPADAYGSSVLHFTTTSGHAGTFTLRTQQWAWTS